MSDFNAVMQAKHDAATAAMMPKFEAAAKAFKDAEKFERLAIALMRTGKSFMSEEVVALRAEAKHRMRSHKNLLTAANSYIHRAGWG